MQCAAVEEGGKREGLSASFHRFPFSIPPPPMYVHVVRAKCFFLRPLLLCALACPFCRAGRGGWERRRLAGRGPTHKQEKDENFTALLPCCSSP